MLYDEDVIHEAVHSFVSQCDRKFDAGLILGSGLDTVYEKWDLLQQIDYSSIKHFPCSKVEGHSGSFAVCRTNDKTMLIMRGRPHLYQGYSAFEVSLPVALMSGLGIKDLILTNACGSLHPKWKSGDIMLLSDHINLQSENCLEAAPHSFIDMSSVYDKKTIETIKSRHQVHEGVYMGLRGPSYETPAEIHMAASLGADVVGMSTIQEAIMARYCEMRVAGIAMISNLAAGISPQPLSHSEVLSAGKSAARRIAEIIDTILGDW